MKKPAILLFSLLLTVNSAIASQDESSSLYSMNFDELMQVEVSIASHYAETVQQAPSAVTVFTRSEISAMGIDNVYDLLNFVPGFQTTRSIDVVSEPLVHSRGLAGLNGEVLFMLNCHRLNENSQGRATRIVRYLSTANIKQVEIIRGPGSALYGNNALLGVVNIITVRDLNDAELYGGSHDALGGHLNISEHIGPLDIASSLSVDRSRGEEYTISGKKTSDPEQNINFFSTLSLGDTDLEIGYMQHKDEDFISFNGVADPGTTWSDTEFFIAALSHKWQINEKLAAHSGLSFTRDKITSSGWFGAASPPTYSYDRLLGPYGQSSSYQADLDLSYDINNSSDLLMGFKYLHAGQDFQGACTNYLSPSLSFTPTDANYLGSCQPIEDIPSLNSREKFITTYDVYGQYRRDILPNLHAVAGASYDKDDITSQINPRLGLIWEAGQGATFKTFWASAFRSPTIAELYTDSPRSLGNLDLKPEEVETLEFVYQRNSAPLTLRRSTSKIPYETPLNVSSSARFSHGEMDLIQNTTA